MVKKIDKEETAVVKAIGKSLKSSPQKTNLVLGLIRGFKVEKAINNLVFSKRRISRDILKILKSSKNKFEIILKDKYPLENEPNPNNWRDCVRL